MVFDALSTRYNHLIQPNVYKTQRVIVFDDSTIKELEYYRNKLPGVLIVESKNFSHQSDQVITCHFPDIIISNDIQFNSHLNEYRSAFLNMLMDIEDGSDDTKLACPGGSDTETFWHFFDKNYEKSSREDDYICLTGMFNKYETMIGNMHEKAKTKREFNTFFRNLKQLHGSFVSDTYIGNTRVRNAFRSWKLKNA